MASITKGVPFAIVSNGAVPAAPPSYYYPNANGSPVPAGCTKWLLQIDQTNIPAGASYGFGIEFHDAVNGWRQDAGGTFSGGQINHRDGSHTFINSLSSSIGSVDQNGNLVGVYPDKMRLRVDSVDGSWVFPSVTFTIS